MGLARLGGEATVVVRVGHRPELLLLLRRVEVRRVEVDLLRLAFLAVHAQPEEYERRVVGFFDEALLGGRR